MDLTKQTRRATEIHSAPGVPGDKTCIDCHKGVAHELPIAQRQSPSVVRRLHSRPFHGRNLACYSDPFVKQRALRKRNERPFRSEEGINLKLKMKELCVRSKISTIGWKVDFSNYLRLSVFFSLLSSTSQVMGQTGNVPVRKPHVQGGIHEDAENLSHLGAIAY